MANGENMIIGAGQVTARPAPKKKAKTKSIESLWYDFACSNKISPRNAKLAYEWFAKKEKQCQR